MPPFIVEPKAAPNASQEGQPSASAQDARSRAIAKLMGSAGNQSQEAPVANPNSVSPEEFGALVAKKKGDTTEPPVSEEAKPASESGQSDTSEAPSDQASEKKEEQLSPQFAMLARKEKALRAKVETFKQQEATLQAREEALKAREAQTEAKYAEQYVSKEALLADPFGTLAQMGYDYDKLTELALNRPQMDPATKSVIDRLEAKIKDLEGNHEKSQQSAKDAQSQQYQQAVAQLKADTTRLVNADPAYELCKAMGAVDDVVELIEKVYADEKVLLTVEEAAAQVEEHLVGEAKRLAGISKFKQFLQPAQQPAQAAQATAPSPTLQQSQPSKTLTNAVGSQRKLTSRERAIMAFEGKKSG